MTDPEIQKITDEYYAAVPHKNARGPKVMILFSGVPGSGKSTVARVLEREFRAVRLSNDEVRSRIWAVAPHAPLKEREAAKLRIATDVLTRVLQAGNGMAIIDTSCDRGYDYYQEFAAKYGYRIVLLRLRVPYSEIKARLAARGDVSVAHLPGWWRQWQTFGRTHTPNLIITPLTPQSHIIHALQQIIC